DVRPHHRGAEELDPGRRPIRRPHFPPDEGEVSLGGAGFSLSIRAQLGRFLQSINRAAASSKNHVTPLPWCEAICAGYFFGSYSSWNTARTASALSSPATTNTVCRSEERRVGKECRS